MGSSKVGKPIAKKFPSPLPRTRSTKPPVVRLPNVRTLVQKGK